MKDPKLRRGELRDALLDEVKLVCESAGPEAVSIAKIGAALGVSSGAPYRLFSERREIFVALIERETMALLTCMEGAITAAKQTPKDRLLSLCRAYISYARDESAMFRLSFSLTSKALDSPKIKAIGQRIYAMVLDAVADVDHDAPRQLIEHRTYSLWCLVHGHALLSMEDQLSDQDMTISDETVLKNVMPLAQQ